jgi:hypothetical protein
MRCHEQPTDQQDQSVTDSTTVILLRFPTGTPPHPTFLQRCATNQPTNQPGKRRVRVSTVIGIRRPRTSLIPQRSARAVVFASQPKLLSIACG